MDQFTVFKVIVSRTVVLEEITGKSLSVQHYGMAYSLQGISRQQNVVKLLEKNELTDKTHCKVKRIGTVSIFNQQFTHECGEWLKDDLRSWLTGITSGDRSPGSRTGRETIFSHESFCIIYHTDSIILDFFGGVLFFASLLFRAAGGAHGSSQAEDGIGAAAADLYHRHSNSGSLTH